MIGIMDLLNDYHGYRTYGAQARARGGTRDALAWRRAQTHCQQKPDDSGEKMKSLLLMALSLLISETYG